jgi:hypothetical protein
MRARALVGIAFAAPTVLQACEGCQETTVTPVQGAGDPEAWSDDIGSWLSMAVSPDNQPAIAYYNRTQDALGYAVGTLGGDGSVTWVHEQVDSYPDENGLNPGDAGRYASLAFAGDGTPWIAYKDSSLGNLKYAHKVDGAWKVGVADTSSKPGAADMGYWASLAIDSSGNPLIAHHDEAEGTLRVARWNGSAFAAAVVDEGQDFVPTDGTDPIPADVGEYAKLLVAGDGTEYIAYYDRAFGALRLARGAGGTFTTELVDGGAGTAATDVGQWPSMLLDGSTLHITYHDAKEQDLEHAYGAPGGFTLETIDDRAFVGADSALFKDGGLGVLYQDATNNDVLVARQRDGAWALETVAGSEAALGFHNETVAIDGKRYAASYDFTNRTAWFAAL